VHALPQAFAHAYRVGAAGKDNKFPCRISSISFKEVVIITYSGMRYRTAKIMRQA
jgi:hypothetical protein